MTGLVGATYHFTATVSPGDTALPVTYVWQASEQAPVTHTVGLSDAVAFSWASAGDKVVSVQAYNAGGSVSDSAVITIDETPPELGTLSFDLDLQGRSDDSAAWITALSGGQPVQSCITSSDGTCSMMVPPGLYNGEVVMPSYLDSVWCFVEVQAGETSHVPPMELRGGDVNDDCLINILDLTPMGGRFGSQCGDPDWDARLDINADCQLNILDLSIAGGNFGQECLTICIVREKDDPPPGS
jgi:hypothetical protein